jgi:hypothetical protein
MLDLPSTLLNPVNTIFDIVFGIRPKGLIASKNCKTLSSYSVRELIEVFPDGTTRTVREIYSDRAEF